MNTPHKSALVTGSATGVGRAVAVALAKRGLAVAVNYSRSQKEAEETAAEVRQAGVPALLCKADVADDGAVRAMVARCREEFGGLDVLVNNAGTTHFIDPTDLDALPMKCGTTFSPSTSRARFTLVGRRCRCCASAAAPL